MQQIYRAKISQYESDNPIVQEFENTGFDGTWIRESVGKYHKQTTIPNTISGLWIGGGFGHDAGSSVFIPIHNYEQPVSGYYTFKYGFVNLKLRLTIEFFLPEYFDAVDMGALFPEGDNEIFLPEVIAYL